jgi:hypothetical protein
LAAAVTTDGLTLIQDTVRDRCARMRRFGQTAEKGAGVPLDELIAQATNGKWHANGTRATTGHKTARSPGRDFHPDQGLYI